MEQDIFDDNLENELLEDDDETGQQREENEDGNDNNVNEDEDASKKDAVPKKIIIRKPQPKLDPERLCGRRGIPIIPDLFAKLKFKGKKHEKEDLDTLMSEYEHWAHRLFPKLKFDTVLDRVEKLGTKKAVQVCVKKMRLDLPILNEDFVGRESDDERDERDGDDPTLQSNQSNTDPFEELLRQDRDSRRTSQATEAPSNADRDSAPRTSTSNVLSEEVRQRIERNKQLAAEKRKKAQERNSLLQNQSLNMSEIDNSVMGPNLDSNSSIIKENPSQDGLNIVSKTVENIVPINKTFEEEMDLNSDDDMMLSMIDM